MAPNIDRLIVPHKQGFENTKPGVYFASVSSQKVWIVDVPVLVYVVLLSSNPSFLIAFPLPWLKKWLLAGSCAAVKFDNFIVFIVAIHSI